MHELVRAALQTGSGAAATLLLGIISTKITAVGLGPEGFGLLAVLTQTLATATMLATFGGGATLVQGLASRAARARDEYLATALAIYVAGAVVTAGVLLLAAPWIAAWLVGRNDAATASLVRWLLVPIALTLAQFFMTNVLNGHRAIGRLAGLQVFGAAATALVAYPLTALIGAGHVLAIAPLLAASPIARLVLSLGIARREGWLDPLGRGFSSLIKKSAAAHFFRLGGVTLITSLTGTGALLAMNALIVRSIGAAELGRFSAAWTLSSTYVLLILGSFSTYYLPTLSRTHDAAARVVLMHRTLRLSLVLVVPLIVTIILLKPLIVSLLYSGEFLTALDTFRWLLIGDYFKVVSWVVAMPVLAYADARILLRTEILWQLGLLASSVLTVLGFGTTQGIGPAFIVLYILYLAYYLWYSRQRYSFWPTRNTTIQWAIGLLVVLFASLLTWNDLEVNWVISGIWLLVAPLYVWKTLTREERRGVWSVARARRRLVVAA